MAWPRASFVPPLAIRRLRDLTRYLAALTGGADPREKQRIWREAVDREAARGRPNQLSVFVRTFSGYPVARCCL
jgi:hypothetical protein